MGFASGDPKDLNGEVFDNEEFEAGRSAGGIYFGIACFPRMMLCYLFGDYEGAAALGKETRALTQNHISPLIPAMVMMFDALTAVGLARKLKRRRVRHANEISKHLHRLSSNAPQNFLVMSNLIDAEIAALKGDHGSAYPKYVAAISISRDEGSFLYNALANELCGKYFLERKDKGTAEGFLRDAALCYKKWDAVAKAQHLVNELKSYGFESLANGPVQTDENVIFSKRVESGIAARRKS